MFAPAELGIEVPQSQQAEETKLLLNVSQQDGGVEQKKYRLDDYDHYAMVNGVEVSVNVCRTCHIVKPPRSFHCSACKACIEVHDHHCPWVGSCVGKRNHRYFFLFNLFTAVHAIYTLILDLVFVIRCLELESQGETPD